MNTEFNKGLLLTSLGSFWWGFIGVIYFEYLSFIGHIELIVHRCLWTAVMLFFTTTFLSKWELFRTIIFNKRYLSYLFISSFLIFVNWSVWIYAVVSDRIIDASFGYFIMPIISVLLGNIFFNEVLNRNRIISISLVLVSILFFIFFNIKGLPWVGLIVAFSWAFYNLVRKKINVDTDIGLFVESLFIFPIAAVIFFFIVKNNLNDFNISDPGLSLFIILAGPMTVIPLFLYVRGVELIGLGPTGMIFYITPTLQFILGYFYYNEEFSIEKLVCFVIIWIAVIIYLRDIYENN